MKTIATVPLIAFALTACQPYGYGQQPGYPPYPQESQGYPQPGYPPYPDPGYPQGGPPMPPGGPVYPGPGQPTQRAPTYPSGETTYRAIGTEPFWDLEMGRELIFTDRGNNVSVSDPTPAPISGAGGETYRTSRLEVNIVHRQCSDGMSDRSYPDTVDVRVDGRQRYRGCGAPIAYFTEVSETGQPNYQAPAVPPGQPGYPGPSGGYSQPNYPGPAVPPGQPGYPGPGGAYGQPNYPGPAMPPGQPGYPGPGGPYGQPGYGGPGSPQGMPVVNLTGTNWRVLSINGTRTPASNFYVNFMPDQMGAKFGCNSMSGSYTQAGSILSIGALAATRMACPDMAFENQASGILQRPVTLSGFGQRITLQNERGSIDLLRAR